MVRGIINKTVLQAMMAEAAHELLSQAGHATELRQFVKSEATGSEKAQKLEMMATL